MYVVDNGNHRIQKFANDGTFLTAWGTEGDGDGQFLRPIGIAVADGEVYVTDDAVPFVQVFDTAGTFLRKFGGAGDKPGRFAHATGIDVDPAGNVWVADYEARRIQRFDPAGTVTGIWRNPEELGGLFQVPEGIVVAPDGTVLTTSYREGEIQVLPTDPGDEVAWEIAGGEQGFGDGKLSAPVDLAIGPDGAVYVTDQQSNTVQRFIR